MRSGISRLFVVVALAFGAVLWSLPLPALAACFGSACIDKDPVAQGCTSGSSVFERRFIQNDQARESLYENPLNCAAFWSRLRTNSGSSYNFMASALWRSDNAVFGLVTKSNVSTVYSLMQTSGTFRGYGIYKVTSSSNGVTLYTLYY